MNSLLCRLWRYQNERFPVLVLFFTTASVILSSTRVFARPISVYAIFPALFAGLAYLFHIRVIDEYRDYSHDTRHHRSRPIQIGIITLAELAGLDAGALILVSIIAVSHGAYASVSFLVLISYSFVAGRDFFLGKRAKWSFFAYNALNLIQLVILQFFVYFLLSPSFEAVPSLLFFHLPFVFMNSVLIEWVRKIRIPEDESTGNDSYSGRLGFGASITAYIPLVIANYLLFFFLLAHFPHSRNGALISIFPLSVLLIAIFRHRSARTRRTEKMLIVSTLLFYIGLNMTIFLI